MSVLGRIALTVFLMAEPLTASAADLFFCEERDAVGYLMERELPERVRFPGGRFTLYMDLPILALSIDGGMSFKLTCQAAAAVRLGFLSCSDGVRLFIFEVATGSFALGRLGGMVFDEIPGQGLTREPMTVSWGTCER